MKKVAIITLLLLFPLVASAANLAGGVCGPGDDLDDCQPCHILEIFNNVVEWLSTVFVPVVAALLFCWAGIVFFFAAGNPEQINKGKAIIRTTIIGLLIFYTAYIIVGLFLSVFNVGAGWYNIDC